MAAIDLKTLLGVAIKTQRTSLGISQEELAHRAGLHRTYISDLERGARNPSIESIEKNCPRVANFPGKTFCGRRQRQILTANSRDFCLDHDVLTGSEQRGALRPEDEIRKSGGDRDRRGAGDWTCNRCPSRE